LTYDKVQKNVDEREKGNIIIEAMIKSITVREEIEEVPEIRKVLWGVESGTNGITLL
jgi:hypothetical protein